MRTIQRLVPCVLILVSLCLGERIKLESYAKSADSIPIAVMTFKSNNTIQLKDDAPGEIISDDLEFSGRFTVVRLSEYDKDKLEKNNAGLYIDGGYTVSQDKITLNGYLRDAATKQQLYGKTLQGEVTSTRAMVHRYVNEVYDMLFGETGPFTSKILFVEDKASVKSVMLMDYDGYNQRKVISQGVNVFPTFLDSTTILFVSFQRGKPDIYKGSIALGTSAIFLYGRCMHTSPAVADVVGKVAYASSRNGNLDIYSCDFDGKNPKQLTFSPGIDTSPCWSPNGYQIAFVSDRSGQPQVYVMDADGVDTRRLTFVGTYQDSPAWSPKGDKIAYASLQNNKFDIWVIGADGTGAVRVTSVSGNNEYPTWSSEGSHIAFVSSHGGRSNIFCIRPDGTGLKQITRSGNAKMPDWSTF